MESLFKAFIVFIYIFTVHYFSVIAFHTKNIQFSKRLDGSTQSAIYMVTLKECWSACKERTFCKSVNYQRQWKKCEMSTGNLDSGPVGGLTLTKGWIYYEDPGEESCSNPASGTNLEKSCPVRECLPLVIENGYVKGNMVQLGNKVKIGCNEGFMSANGPNIEVISECKTSGMFDKFITCFPVTCIKVAKSTFVDKLKSASYRSFDAKSGQIVHIFCDFDPDTSLGYTYFSKSTLRNVTSLTNHYNVYDHVIIRHHDVEINIQYSSKLQMLSRFLDQYPNVSVFLNEHPRFKPPNSIDGDYIYLGFVPGVGPVTKWDKYGYSCNGVDKVFGNCDGNANNYFVVYGNGHSSLIKGSSYESSGIGVYWKDCKQKVDDSRIMAQEYFYDKYEIHMGGCGVLAISNIEGVKGMSFGLPFNY